MAQKSTVLVWLASIAGTLVLAADVRAQAGRDYVYIVGSSTVYPFSTVVAERFGRGSGERTPKVEATGSGGGLKLFCDGIGASYPDIANASRAIKASEVERCAVNGVRDIVEVRIGYDGIVLANAARTEPLALSLQDIYLALAKHVPGEDAESVVPNPHRNWSDVRAGLPRRAIEVLGPPPTSGTRDAFLELAMEAGCRAVPWIAALEETEAGRFRSLCHAIREDGAYVDAGENDNLIVQKLQANPGAFGIFGFSFLDQNAARVRGVAVEGVEPTFEAIADGSYPIARPLYFYLKSAHLDLIPGLRGFLAEFTSERAWGDDGYLSDRGLVPMPAAERAEIAARVRELAPRASARN